MYRARMAAVMVLAGLLAPTDAQAQTTYHMATNGRDDAPGTSGAPLATFARAFQLMAGGDRLIVKDGTYAQQLRDIPSGTDAAYTTIQAENDFRVTITGGAGDGQALFVNGHHIRIEGMKFNGLQVRNSAILSGAHHVKVLRSAFFGAPCGDNTTVISAGPGSSDLLFEDSWAFGCGRYKFTVYQSERVIFRRCVSRHDYHDYEDDQCATFTNYDSNDVHFQNCVALDSGQDPQANGTVVGAFWVPNDLRGVNNVSVLGSIFLNLDTLTFADQSLFGARVIRDSVAWHVHGGMEFLNIYDDWQGRTNPSLTVDHVTMGDVYGIKQDATLAGGVGFTGLPGYSDFPATVSSSLLTQCNEYGVGTDIRSDHNVFWDNGQDYDPAGYGAGTGDLHADPQLKYIVRPEVGSPLKGAGAGGSDAGATILQRYGRSGTLWGEPGWNELTTESLWPFPHEDEIKRDMSSWTGPHDGTRGFCARGNGLYGGPITLTSYIWEYLGNVCPGEVCGNATRRAPAVPQGLSATAGDHQVTLTWTPNTEQDLGGYKVYMATSAAGTYSPVNASASVSATTYLVTGLDGSTPYHFKISAVNTFGDESELSEAVSATPTGTGPAGPGGSGGGSGGGGGGGGGCSAADGTGGWPAVAACVALLALLRRRGARLASAALPAHRSAEQQGPRRSRSSSAGTR